jgi:hypothetical protein
MNRTPVSSSNIKSIGYDSQSNTLEVEFRDGSIYQYYSVLPHIYNGLMRASSHGQYLDDYVKKGGYRYRKIR